MDNTFDTMRRNITFIVCLFSWVVVPLAYGQEVLSLSQAIQMAHEASVEAQVAKDEYQRSYWSYRTYRAELLPEVTLSGMLPDYRRSYNLYQNADGSQSFVRTNSLILKGELSVEQDIWFTGGKVRLSSSLQYLNPLGMPGQKPSFMTVPVGVTLEQPIFGANHTKWARRIEPVKYKETQAKYVADVEQVTLKAIALYFSLLMAEENLKIAEQNQKNATRIHEIAQARREMGQISENELLQLQLSSLNADSKLTDMRSQHRSAMFSLISFLGLSEHTEVIAELPSAVQYPVVSYEDVLTKATANNPLLQTIRRRQLEADYEVAQAKGNLRQIHLFASIGYTGQDQVLRPAYQNLIDNQVVQVGVKIPLLDWGKRRGQVKVAESNREVTRAQVKKQQIDFNQDLFLLIEHYNNQAKQMEIARASDEIAQKRYDTSVESFMIGKINTLDLADAQISKDKARANFINEMYLYWYYFYQLRSLTLYDFQKNQNIVIDM